MEKIIHQIWVGPYRMPKREQELSKKMMEFHPDWKYMFWNDESVSKLEMPQNVKDSYDFYGKINDYVAQCDVIRFYLIYKFGGIYLDVDFEVREGLNSLKLEQYDAFICYHDSDNRLETFPNGIMGCKKGNDIFKYIVEKMEPNNFYTPHKFAEQVRNYYGLEYEKTTNSQIIELFSKSNIFYMVYNDFHNNNCFHHALYSWSIEGKKKFREGDYE